MTIGVFLMACSYQPPGGTSMSLGEQAKAPRGYVDFCERHAEDCRDRESSRHRVRLTENRWIELNSINTSTNVRIRPVTDRAQHNQIEVWQYPKGVGDCEDYALEKRRRLIEAGWPEKSLRMATARNQKGNLHAVLIVVTEQGDYVLDNVTNRINAWDRTAYQWVARQSTENPMVWHKIGTDTATTTVALNVN